MKHIFLTGGTGFFGKSILSMVMRGTFPEYQFTILSRNPERFLDDNSEFQAIESVSYIQGDVRDFQFPQGHFDYVLHAGTPAMDLPPGVQRDIILKGTERTLDFAKQCGAEKFMFVSSGAVYGPQPANLELIPENSSCHPCSEYGIAKLEAEQMCISSGIHTLLPRCFAFVGPYLNRNIHFAIGNFIRDALNNEIIEIKGDGTPLRSYMYADDLVRWIFTIMEHGHNGRPYNVGSDEAISILELAKTVRDVLKSKAEIHVASTPIDDHKPSRYIPSIERAKTEFDLSLSVSLKSAILKSVHP